MFDENKCNRDEYGQFAEKDETAYRQNASYGEILSRDKERAAENEFDISKKGKNILETKQNSLDKRNQSEVMTEEEFNKFLGPNFDGVKGKDAIVKLMDEKCGHVKGAFTRSDIGKIDLFWGNEDVGLCHILERREMQGIDISEFINGMTEVVEQGYFSGPAKAKDSLIFRTKDKTAIIGYTYKGNHLQYVLTAFLSHGGGATKRKPPQ